MKDKIIKIIEDSFEKHIRPDAEILDNSIVCGYDPFMNEISNNLDVIFAQEKKKFEI